MNGDNKKIIVERIMAELLDEIKKYDDAIVNKADPKQLKLIVDRKDSLLKELTGFYLDEKRNKK